MAVASAPGVFIKSVELRLLRCTLSRDPSAPSERPLPSALSAAEGSLRPIVEHLVVSIERGSYADALAYHEASRLVFGDLPDSWEFDDTVDCAARFYADVERRVHSFLREGDADAWLRVLDGEPDVDVEGRKALVLCLGVAALLAFTQQNVTGPVASFCPFPLFVKGSKKDETTNSGGQWDLWAKNQVASVGSDVHGKFPLLQFLVYAKILLSKIKDSLTLGERACQNDCKSVHWWLCRLFLLQQRILDMLSSSLYELLQPLKDNMLLHFGIPDSVAIYWGSMLYNREAFEIASLAQIETGIVEYKYGRIDSSKLHINRAEESCGLHFTVTGALGYRTVHQVDAKPQLVLAANTEEILDRRNSTRLAEHQGDDAISQSNSLDGPAALVDCSDILMIPRLVENQDGNRIGGDLTHITKDIKLTPIQQAVILGQCLILKRRSRDDELSNWEMAPYIEAIDCQCDSYYTVRSFCDVLRIRWEATRSRTKQRALLMMDKLVEVFHESLPVATERGWLAYGVYIPSIPALRKEYSELLVSCGMVGEALRIFEDLELWDNLIHCYQLLGKKAAAVDLIKTRLQDVPNDPRLWCSLGDVTNDDAHYEKALEVSNNRSARAKRSLARNAYNRGDYVAAKDLWESALALNSLYPDGWFALGAAALKSRDIDKALDAFTRAVQLDPDNGEAWNNVACLHMVKKKSKASFIAFREALKFRRDSWQLWENFSHVAFDIGNIRQALEATKRVLDLSDNKRADIALLDKILCKVEDRTRSPQSTETHPSESLNGSLDESGNEESVLAESRETDFLLDMLGHILQQVVRNGGQGDIWGLYARWHKIKGDLTMCCEAFLKQVRSFQGSELWHNPDRFKKFAHASLELCKVYMEIASSTGSQRELVMAEMHLRSSVRQASNFSGTKELKDLEDCLDEVRRQLNATSNGSS